MSLWKKTETYLLKNGEADLSVSVTTGGVISAAGVNLSDILGVGQIVVISGETYKVSGFDEDGETGVVSPAPEAAITDASVYAYGAPGWIKDPEYMQTVSLVDIAEARDEVFRASGVS